MSQSIGILIIGSLYWEPGRRTWRDGRLRMDDVRDVHAPIRYGRLSVNRGNTYTMIFSRLCAVGSAKAVRCSTDISNVYDLIAEAEHLWAAERNKPSNGRISADWGRVALLSNPGRDIPQTLLDSWAARVSHEPSYVDVPQEPHEGSLVSNRGILQIPWPTLASSGEAVPLDLLLATANHPTFAGVPPRYPDPRQIAEAWRKDKAGNVSYFRNNQRDGIRTFQDEAINRLLRPGCLGRLARWRNR